jgi:hypothetical protein
MKCKILATVPLAARHARDSHPPAVLCIVMPDSLDIPVPQCFSSVVARQRMRVLCVAQLPLQRGHQCVVRTERRMPLAAGPLVASAKRKHALSLGCVPFQHGDLVCHRSGRPPLTPARFGQREEPAAHTQTAHPREQPPKIRLLRRAAHHAGGSPAHNACNSARVSTNELLRSYG